VDHFTEKVCCVGIAHEYGCCPSLHSYTLECKRCWGHGFGLRYTKTVLFFVVVLFHISASSPPLNVFVFFCHITVYTFPSLPDLYYLYVNELRGSSSVLLLKVMLALCGLWSLDFPSHSSSFLCEPKHYKPTGICTGAFYSLILILITYICIKLHDHNFRPVVLLWKPFHQCFVYFRRSWNSRACVINTFATIFLLSSSKILL